MNDPMLSMKGLKFIMVPRQLRHECKMYRLLKGRPLLASYTLRLDILEKAWEHRVLSLSKMVKHWSLSYIGLRHHADH